MKHNFKLILLILTTISIISCSKNNEASNKSNTLTVDIGAEISSLDPARIDDINSSRVSDDLFAKLVTFDQSGKLIPDLAESWTIHDNNKSFLFHLRPDIKFSDGSPITAQDVVFTFRRLADPKFGSPYSMYMQKLQNGVDVVNGKIPLDKLGITAKDNNTVEIMLTAPEPAFINMLGLTDMGIVPKHIINKFGNNWTDTQNIVTSGAYTLKERVVNGHMLVQKNPYYYDVKKVEIPYVQYLPIIDANSSLNQYKSGDIDITWTIPTSQYQDIKNQFGNQLKTRLAEALVYLDLNMTLPKYAQNKSLRQALSMAIDRNSLTKDVLSQGQQPIYSIVTPTIENGSFANLNYNWANQSYKTQLRTATELFAKSGYSSNKPLKITISYGNSEINKKITLAVAAMWKSAFGNSIQVTTASYEWKTFLAHRKLANYDIERTGWLPSYDYVDNYMVLYTCGSPQNSARYCNQQFDNTLASAKTMTKEMRIDKIRNAILSIQNDYFTIPLFQNVNINLINPRVKGYNEDHNHLNLEQSKWYHF